MSAESFRCKSTWNCSWWCWYRIRASRGFEQVEPRGDTAISMWSAKHWEYWQYWQARSIAFVSGPISACSALWISILILLPLHKGWFQFCGADLSKYSASSFLRVRNEVSIWLALPCRSKLDRVSKVGSWCSSIGIASFSCSPDAKGWKVGRDACRDKDAGFWNQLKVEQVGAVEQKDDGNDAQRCRGLQEKKSNLIVFAIHIKSQ